MTEEQSKNPLHGLTLKAIVEDLVARHGWEELARRIRIACFRDNPSVASSLKFLRKTGWARAKVEKLYLADRAALARRRAQNKRRADKRAYRREQEALAARAAEAANQPDASAPPAPDDQPEP